VPPWRVAGQLYFFTIINFMKEGDEKRIQNFRRNFSREELLANPRRRGRVLLKYILEKEREGVGWIQLDQVTAQWRVS
jgi:hypothetical protein